MRSSDDCTALKQAGLAQLAPSLMRVAEALGWPLVLVDAQGRLQHANTPAVRLMAEHGHTAAWCWPGRPGGQVGQLRPLQSPAPDTAGQAVGPDAPALWLLDLRGAVPPRDPESGAAAPPGPPPFGK